jgi:CDP-glycerol glycerophosphotransferase
MENRREPVPEKGIQPLVGGKSQLLIDEINTGSRVFIYGTGSAGRSLWMWLKKCREDVKVLGFIDSFRGGHVAWKPVFQLDAFNRRYSVLQYDIVLVASGANREIASKLEKEGIVYAIVSVPSYLMENLLPIPLSEKARELKIRCMSPFFKCRNHLFFGEHGGKFIGNNKYYYLYLKERTTEPVYWVVEDDDLFLELQDQGIDVLDFRAPETLYILLRAAYFYFDNMTWQRKYPWLRYFKAKIIHMSHGVGLKMTEKMLIPQEFMKRLTKRELQRLNSKIFNNSLLISTSEFYAKNVSEPAYNTPMERITLSGYPKNDLFYKDIPGCSVFTDKQTLGILDIHKSQGGKVIVYAPTFRDMDVQFKYADVIDYRVLDQHLVANQMLLVIKSHASVGGLQDSDSYRNILFYDNQKDGYPLLKEADLLVTDYSSIYMDFLHCRKPVLYFVYDYTHYIENHREIQFDFHKMTPGPKAENYQQLITWLGHFLVKEKDDYKLHRERVFDLAFKYKDGDASARIFDRLKVKE